MPSATPMPNAAPLQRTHSRQDLVRALIRYIQTEGLATGDRLPPIRALAEQFEVTSSAIRDTQIQLQTVGMIKILPRSGAFVRSVSLEPLVGAMTDTLDNALMQAMLTIKTNTSSRSINSVFAKTKSIA